MERPRVFITRKIPEIGINIIKEHYEVEVWSDEKEPPREVLLEKIKDVDALVTLLSDKIDFSLFQASPFKAGCGVLQIRH